MKKILFIALILVSSLSCSKSYVGQNITTYDDSWCQCETLFVKACRIASGSFDFEFTVSKQISKKTGRMESKIEGTAIWSGETEPSSSSESDFRIILANGRMITENIPFQLESTGSENKAIPFQKTFTSGPFEAVTISWKTSVQNQLELQ